MQTAKFVKEIEVVDPDTNGVVHLEIYKHDGGGMFAIDSSFIEQEAEDKLEDGRTIIVDPFYEVFELRDESQYLILED